MIKIGKDMKVDFFRINGEQVKVSDATILIGIEGQKALGINCGGCGHTTCAEMLKAVKAEKNKKALYPGPNCVLKISDLGIAVGSAVKTASIHNVDNRIMFGTVLLPCRWACSRDAVLLMVSRSRHPVRTFSGI